jgi:DEAD/DEAH box helicase domain-containing protein
VTHPNDHLSLTRKKLAGVASDAIFRKPTSPDTEDKDINDRAGRIKEYVEALSASKVLGHRIVYQRIFPEKPESAVPAGKLRSRHITQILKSNHIRSLYSHQLRAIRSVRSGRHVVVATPTASGKTMIYNLPVIEKILENPNARALYIFPLKALAQDQMRTFEQMVTANRTPGLTAAIYDGDTSDWHRKKIRQTPPNVILTNPEMIHLSFLAHHQKWETFFSNLSTVVIDEVHTYRGVLGSHMAQIFRRLRRICKYYGADPTYVFSSATIANPAGLTRDLTGLEVETEADSGAPQGRRYFMFLNPELSASHAAILLLKAALHRELRTIIYTQSRKMTELISVWAGSQKGKFAGRISAYRAGYLPEERREIEHKLVSGELLAVVSTSALELGIDIGNLDLCILVGYPGTVMSTWQRGGRVGRSGHDSAVIMIAGEDALDQYFMRNPDMFFSRGPEAAVINPDNPSILKKHLVCAAAELPLRSDEPYMSRGGVPAAAAELEKSGGLLRSGCGMQWFSSSTSPHRHVDLRGTGERYAIITGQDGTHLGEIDGFRAFKETHPGAIYLHHGRSFQVDRIDTGTGTITVSPVRPVYYTRVQGHKETEILETIKEQEVFNTRVGFGRLKVTDQVTGYEKRHIYGKHRISVIPLDLPPIVFETEGLWFAIPKRIADDVATERLHFMGGIHAVEHAVIGICPLFVLTDRNDFGGISIPFHPQVGDAAVFIYDSFPGGIGLTRQAFSMAGELLAQTRKLIASCPCETGCPSCVHSPKCGSGNRPIDKAAAGYILDRLTAKKPGQRKSRLPAATTHPATSATSTISVRKSEGSYPRDSIRFGVLDIETRRSAQEVGGWHNAHRMGISCAVLYDSRTDAFSSFTEDQAKLLIATLKELDLIVGFNIRRFDYKVLSAYTDADMRGWPTLDLLESVHLHLGYRVSLDNLALASLGAQKTADGLQALRWWKAGNIADLVAYCQKDVAITMEIYRFGQNNGYVLFHNKAGQSVRIPVDW